MVLTTRVFSGMLLCFGLAVGLVVSAVEDASAASPLMSTAPGSSGAACGAAGADLCVPSVDVTLNFPAALPTVLTGAASLGLVAGDVINSISFGHDRLNSNSAKIYFSVTSGSAGAAGVAPDVASEATAGEAGRRRVLGRHSRCATAERAEFSMATASRPTRRPRAASTRPPSRLTT